MTVSRGTSLLAHLKIFLLVNRPSEAAAGIGKTQTQWYSTVGLSESQSSLLVTLRSHLLTQAVEPQRGPWVALEIMCPGWTCKRGVQTDLCAADLMCCSPCGRDETVTVFPGSISDFSAVLRKMAGIVSTLKTKEKDNSNHTHC